MLYRHFEDAEPGQDDKRDGEGVERRVGDERWQEAAGPLEESAQAYRQDQERRQQCRLQVEQGEDRR